MVLEVGLIGFGTVGRGVATRALGLQMRVVAVDARPPAQTPPGLAWIGKARGDLNIRG